MKNKEALEALKILADPNIKLLADEKRRLANLVKAALTQPEQEWQDISTAPRYGVFMVTSHKSWPPYIVVNTAKEYSLRSDYPFHTYFAMLAVHKSKATHWRPLPKPPLTGG